MFFPIINSESWHRQLMNQSINHNESRSLFRPGDSLKPGEDELEGLKRALNQKLAPSGEQSAASGSESGLGDWEIGELLSVWWRPNFETYMVSCFGLGLLQAL
jgi:hypothetical protein